MLLLLVLLVLLFLGMTPALLLGSLSWDCNCLEQLMEPTQPQHHPGTGLYWEHWEGAAGGGCGHLGWGKGLIHEPGYTWGIHFPSGSDPEGDIQESLDLLG